jgi:hypothetical protein
MGKLLPSEWGPVLGPSKELYPDCVIDSDHEFVFSAAIAASFNQQDNRTVETGVLPEEGSTKSCRYDAAGYHHVMCLKIKEHYEI